MTVYGPRTRSAVKTVPRTYRWSQKDGNGVVVAYWDTTASTIESRSMYDVVVDNFQERIKSGQIINNPMTQTLERITQTPRSGVIYFNDGGGQPYIYSGSAFMYYPDYLSVPASNIQSAKDLAITNAYAKVDSQEAQILVTLGELRETKEMFISAVRKIHTVNKHLRNWDYLRRTSLNWRHIRDAWMEVRFGWRPFVSEVRKYFTAHEKLRVYPKRQTFRSTVPISGGPVSDTTSIVAGPNIWTFSRYASITGHASAGVLCEQRYAGFPDIYGLWDIPGTVWELTKLSWFVDYFFNVGKVIASWTPDTLWRPLCAWVVTRYTENQNIAQETHTFNHQAYTGGTSGLSLHRSAIHCTREPNPERPILPQFSVNMDWQKYTDAVALGSQYWEKTKSLLGRPMRKR